MMTMFTGQHSYDAFPYPHLSHSDTHPSKLATIGTLLGLDVAPAETCRVLEVGCASGGNLIPMAEALPDSTFVGVDYSAGQIEEAQATVDALGLDNISFHAQDIRALDDELGTFDYIIAHGVYSWVPEDVRNSLLTLCQRQLNPQGVAYISYNTLPGYHLMLMVREMMLWHTRHLETSTQQMTEAYRFIQFLAKATRHLGQNNAYHTFLQDYIERRFDHHKHTDDPLPDTTLLHDEMEDVNHPVYFHEFMAHAEQHDLQYLAEVPFSEMMAARLPQSVAQQLGSYAKSRIELEQYLDFLRSRMFRRTLLCRAEVAVQRQLDPARVMGLWVSSQAKSAAGADDPPGAARFEDEDGISIATDHPVSKAALQLLIEQSPYPLSFEALLEAACDQLGRDTPTAEDRQVLAVNLLQGFVASPTLITLHAHPPGYTPAASQRPVARPLARYDARQSEHTTNLRHERVALDGLARAILPWLDGSHDRGALTDKLLAAVRAGDLTPRDNNNQPLDTARARQVLPKQVDAVLDWLARSALLVE